LEKSITKPELAFEFESGARAFTSCTEETGTADSAVRPEPPNAESLFVTGARPKPRTSKRVVTVNHVTVPRCLIFLA